MSHVKLFATITDSSIWDQPDHVCKIWITLLAMADWHGCVYASLPGLANRARKSIAEVEEALEVFRAPDRYSRSAEYDGRRLMDIDGGWMLLNYTKHREARNAEALRESKRISKAREREAKRVEAGRSLSPDVEQGRTTTATSRIKDSVVSDLDLGSDPDPEGVQGEVDAMFAPELDDAFDAAVVWDGGPVHPEDEPQEAPSSRYDAFDAPVQQAKVAALPDDWKPSEALYAAAEMAGVPRAYFDERIADLRLGPIGGTRGVWANKIDDFIIKLIPKWRTWFEEHQAKQGPKSAPEAKLPGLPKWVRASHQKLIGNRDLKPLAMAFAKGHHINPKNLNPGDAAAAFTGFLKAVASGSVDAP